MRIGCLQFAPQVGDVDNNLNRADAVLSRANPDDLDLLVLPELAFSGYNFKSLQDIAPFLEPSGSGITSLWARTIALKYNCTVTVGYPEKVDVSPKWPTGPEYYNSVIVVNGDGETIANYRKSFLYYTDETWALEGGQGFYEGFIPGLGNTSIGICMDLNPYKFEAPWHNFEFAYHVVEVESNLVIVSMAWSTREDPRRFTRMPNEPDMETLTYWVTRLEPLIRAESEDEIIVVFCNRAGNEDEAMYAGTSAVIGILDGEVRVYGLLGRGEKELLVVDTNNSPYAKLVYRPDPRGTGMEAPGKLQRNDEVNNPRSNEVRRPSEDNNNGDESKSTSNKASSPYPSSATAKLPHPFSSMSQRCTLPKDGVNDSPRRRQTPTIAIPPAPGLVISNSARSPGLDSLNIPTPSAPSPTPMSMRPRLVIPESPPILPHQYPADHPISAASLRSERSVRSNMSHASTSTVQTRPPEDSTPYPNSAAPLSGYPTNTFKSEEYLYTRRFTDFDPDDRMSPSLSLDGMSPTDARWFWRPSDSAGPTPLSAGWTPTTAVGRKPEPFPWSEITGDIRPMSAGTLHDRNKNNSTPKDLRAFSPLSNTSSNRTNGTIISESSEASRNSRSSRVSRGTAKSPAKQDKHHARPPSPKSRNASRTGTRERSDSSLEARDISDAITQHLEGISQRAESASRLRSESASSARHEWPQFRNRSSSRPKSAINAQPEHHMIPIAASPSLFRNENQNQHRPPSRKDFDNRGESFNSLEGVLQGFNGERVRTPTTNNASARTNSRAASRGRMPDPKPLPVNGAYDSMVPSTERSSSHDSTRNELLHSRTSHHRSRGRPSRTRRTSSGQNGRMSSRDVPSREFDRVESIVCPNCPVHGRNLSASGNRHTESAPPINHPIARPVTVRPVTVSPPGRRESASIATVQQNRSSSHAPTQRTENASFVLSEPSEQAQDKASEYATNEVAETSDSGSFAETLQTISTPGRSPATPSFFNPSTPKAMVFKTDDLDVDLFPTGHLNANGVPAASISEADTVRVA